MGVCGPTWGLALRAQQKILDFTYIDDAVDGISNIIDNYQKVKNDTFNIASGYGIRLYDVAKLINSLFNNSSKIILKKNRLGEVWRYIADISKAKKMLGYNPQYDVKRGLVKTVDWYKKCYL